MPRVSVSRLLVPVAVLFLLAGCADDPDPNALAAAKCHVPLGESLNVSPDQFVRKSDVEVRDLGGGRREVTGFVLATPDGRPRSFVCVVTPDASDKLRGLRVERLEVQ